VQRFPSSVCAADFDRDGMPDLAVGHGELAILINLRDAPTGVDEPPTPARFSVSQNYPNPFNPSTVIEFKMPHPGFVSLDIFDVAGRKVRTLVSDYRGAGAQKVGWDGRDDEGGLVSSGVYFYRVTAAGFREARKMVLLR
jgi:hypothetical protein